jgi:predicted alpha-1,2-mannosidase
MQRSIFTFVWTIILTILAMPVISQERGPADLVDPFIGTGGHGHTYPGAVYPFGMVQLSPDTRLEGWDGCSAYHYTDSVTYGFSHTHLSGTGIPDYADILFMPYTGEPALFEQSKIGSVFNHDNEVATPGFYACDLETYNIKAELTVTERCGFHQYDFPKAPDQKVMVDLTHRDFVLDSYIKIVDKYEIQGYRFSSSWAKDQKVYFVARFSQPIENVVDLFNQYEFSSLDELDLRSDSIRVSLGFDIPPAEKLLIKVGISGVSMEGARKNLMDEIPDWDFEGVRKKVRQAGMINYQKLRYSEEAGSSR